MKKLIAVLAIAVTPGITSAQGLGGLGVGVGGYSSHTDAYGNTYQTNRFGNGNSMTNGYNARTGSTWSQRTVGGLTTGIDSGGNSWSSYDYGGGFYGTDSSGNSYSCVRGLGGQVICN